MDQAFLAQPCSMIWSLYKSSTEALCGNFTWIPGNEMTIRIWEDIIMYKYALKENLHLVQLHVWMKINNLTQLADIMTWDDDGN